MTHRVTLLADPDDDPDLIRIAGSLADELHLPLADDPDAVRLAVTPGRLELRLPGDRGRPVVIDLSGIDTRSRAGGKLRQPLIKAVGIRKRDDAPSVIDATAGLGEDAHLLASFGCRVTAIERNGVVAALLRDALRRTGSDVELICADACTAMRDLRADVVYIDPMYPAERKTAQRKPLVALRMLVGDDDDATSLFAAARAAATKRIVVKRPRRAPPLAGAPHHTHQGKAVRYDVYMAA